MTDATTAAGFPGRRLPTPTFFDPSFERLPAAAAFDPARPGPVLLLYSQAADRSWVADAAITLATGWNATGRRTVLADLSLEDPVLGERIGMANMEGITDIFLYGASLARSARPVPGRGFYLIPAGTYTDDATAVLRHPRWEKIVAGFAEAGASLLLFAPADLPGLDALGRWAGEVIVLGPPADEPVFEIALPTGAAVRAWLTPPAKHKEEPAPRAAAAAPPPPPAKRFPEPEPAGFQPWNAPPREPTPPPPPGPAPLPHASEAVGAPAAEIPVPDPSWEEDETPRKKRKGPSPVFLGVALLLLLLILGYVLVEQFYPQILPWNQEGAAAASTAAEAPRAAPQRPAGPAVAAGTVLPYAVFVKAYDNYEAARRQAEEVATAFPDKPFYVIPEDNGGRVYYKVYSGVLGDSLEAASLRERLLDRGAVNAEDVGTAADLIQERPLAFDLGEFGSAQAARARADSLAVRAVPAYTVAVPYTDGTERWKLYGGAFADSASAAAMGGILRSNGLPATLVRRTGRPPAPSK